jgi:hypothetical protein
LVGFSKKRSRGCGASVSPAAAVFTHGPTRHRGFEFFFLHQRVRCEPDSRGCRKTGRPPPVPHAPITRGTEGSNPSPSNRESAKHRSLSCSVPSVDGRGSSANRFDDSRAGSAFVGLPRAEKSDKMRSRGATEGGRASKMLGQSRLKGYLGKTHRKDGPWVADPLINSGRPKWRKFHSGM